MSTLSNGTANIAPDLILGFESSNEAGTRVHRILGGSIDATLGDDWPRAGTLRLFFAVEADAEAARQLLIVGAVWALAADIATATMSFVRTGELAAAQQDARLRWILNVGYQEVSA